MSGLYPEGSTKVSIILPTPVKEATQRVAIRNRQSMSQFIAFVLEDYLLRRGEIGPATREGAA